MIAELTKIKYRCLNSLEFRFWKYFYVLYRPYVFIRARQIRHKSRIKVLFVIAELSAWKTELLYLSMLGDERFVPILGVADSQEVPGSKNQLVQYLHLKGYEFVDLDFCRKSLRNISADVIFYYKPYDRSYPPHVTFKNNLKALVCDIGYCFTITNLTSTLHKQIYNYTWLSFVENDYVREARIGCKLNKVRNVVVTGLPMQDALCFPVSHYDNPWKNLGLKKIIYAPHHSLPDTNQGGVHFSTFLDYGEFILGLARKYSSEVQWAFKPHPTLYPKLVRLWGQERTDSYYKEWETLPNAQIEQGEYTGLFMHSDAMVHDSASFIIEYLYTKKPVAYLETTPLSMDEFNDSGRNAYNMHYHVNSKESIEEFVMNVIAGRDNMRDERAEFYDDFLIPPHKQPACTNIMEAILGRYEF